MALKLYTWDGDEWVEVDLVDEAVSSLILSVSYSHPAKLSWTMHQPQHTLPIPYFTPICLVDTTYADGDTSTPVFLGHVVDIQPADTLRLEYAAYDPTYRATQEITIMSGPDTLPETTARLVYNVMIEQDDDLAFERNHTRQVGGMIADLLTDPLTQLRDRFAAPADADAYVAGDLDDLDYVPQEKQVFESESLRSGLDRLLAMYPQYRMWFNPVDRRWRFRDVQAATQLTITLNSISPSAKLVMSGRLDRSLDRRYSAVKIFGPRAIADAEASVSADSAWAYDSSSSSSSAGHLPKPWSQLTELWTFEEEGDFIGGGPGTAGTGNVSRTWQIADPALRQLAHHLLNPIEVPMWPRPANTIAWVNQVTWSPTLLATWDDGETWEPVGGWYFLDAATGKIQTTYHLFKREDESSTSGDGAILLPDDVRFFFAYYSDPLIVRYPVSGYEGTVSTVAGLDVEMRIFDESLASGYEFGRPYAKADRLAQFQKLAENRHKAQKDIAYTGGLVIAGIDYDFLRLGKRINLAAVNANGSPLVTGWESINAVLSDVEYDYSERVTSLTFNSDLMEFGSQDPETLKRLLKIQAVKPADPLPLNINYVSQIRDINTGKVISSTTLAQTIVLPGGSLNAGEN